MLTERVKVALILAAGKGTRMSSYFRNYPKALLKVKNVKKSTILDQQIQSLVKCGYHHSNITIVVGHMSDVISKFILDHYPLIQNGLVISTRREDYEMMGSLCESIFRLNTTEGCTILYGDIVFDREILRVQSSKDISLVIDTNPTRRYELRNKYVEKGESSHFFEEEAEKVWVDRDDNIRGIGKYNLGWERVKLKGEFSGIMNLSKRGMLIFKSFIRKYKGDYDKNKIPRIATNTKEQKPLQSLYVTEFLQYLIESGISDTIELCCMDLNRRLYEFDTPSDVRAWKKFREDFIWDSLAN